MNLRALVVVRSSNGLSATMILESRESRGEGGGSGNGVEVSSERRRAGRELGWVKALSSALHMRTGAARRRLCRISLCDLMLAVRQPG